MRLIFSLAVLASALFQTPALAMAKKPLRFVDPIDQTASTFQIEDRSQVAPEPANLFASHDAEILKDHKETQAEARARAADFLSDLGNQNSDGLKAKYGASQMHFSEAQDVLRRWAKEKKAALVLSQLGTQVERTPNAMGWRDVGTYGYEIQYLFSLSSASGYSGSIDVDVSCVGKFYRYQRYLETIDKENRLGFCGVTAVKAYGGYVENERQLDAPASFSLGRGERPDASVVVEALADTTLLTELPARTVLEFTGALEVPADAVGVDVARGERVGAFGYHAPYRHRDHWRQGNGLAPCSLSFHFDPSHPRDAASLKGGRFWVQTEPATHCWRCGMKLGKGVCSNGDCPLFGTAKPKPAPYSQAILKFDGDFVSTLRCDGVRTVKDLRAAMGWKIRVGVSQ